VTEPTDALTLLDGTRLELYCRDTAHNTYSANRPAGASPLDPGLYLTDPQGHALLVGINGRELTILDGGPTIVGGIQVDDPDVLDALADRLRFIADRRRRYLAAQKQTLGFPRATAAMIEAERITDQEV